MALYNDKAATLDDLREAVTTLEEIERTMQRIFGNAHPVVLDVEQHLKKSRAALCARESWCPSSGQLVFAFAIVFLAWMCWKFGWGAMVFTFAVINFAPYVIPE